MNVGPNIRGYAERLRMAANHFRSFWGNLPRQIDALDLIDNLYDGVQEFEVWNTDRANQRQPDIVGLRISIENTVRGL